jgi:hypothetical protein
MSGDKIDGVSGIRPKCREFWDEEIKRIRKSIRNFWSGYKLIEIFNNCCLRFLTFDIARLKVALVFGGHPP